MSDRLIISQVLYFTEPTTDCGYCRGKKCRNEEFYALGSWYQFHSHGTGDIKVENCTVGIQAELMSLYMYDKLCNMGFRRSGKFLYKTDMLRNCCRLYTIRTTNEQVNLSKESKTTLKRFVKQILPNKDCSQAPKKPNKRYDYIHEIIEAETKSTDFKTHFEPALFTNEKYELFSKYQEHIHNDFNHNAKSFKRFLCESPFSRESIMGTEEEWIQLNNWKNMGENEKLKRLGPTHECYYYKDKMIALAVTDFLPSGISSVYFIWDPAYHKWSLGKVSALRELCITSKINREYYYMGYYIDDCPKMNYKAKYGGELLDVCNHQYAPLMKVKNMISHGKLFALADLYTELPDNKIDEVYPLEEIPINDKLDVVATNVDRELSVTNIVERIYGVQGKAFSSANEAAARLSHLGIPYAPERSSDIYKSEEEQDENKIHSLPNVIPGLVPLSEILNMVMSGKINALNRNLALYDTEQGGVRLVLDFHDESKQIKKIICDVVRLIGLKNTLDALIII